MSESVFILGLAFLLDTLIGDPRYPLHPVRLIGFLATGVEKALRRLRFDGVAGGTVLAMLVLASSISFYLFLRIFCERAHHNLALFVDVFFVYSCIAARDMIRHALPIANALENSDLDAGRRAVGKIVGRDPAMLDAHAVARASVESVSESFVDGVLSPILWFTIGALAGSVIDNSFAPVAGTCAALLQRATNTLDSMVGYKNSRYEQFGKISARLDDIVNFIPARLAIVGLAPASTAYRQNTAEGFRIMRRDRLKHSSPNSGHTESFIAGALGLSLGGPSTYTHGEIKKPWIGDGTQRATAEHIRATCRMVSLAGGLAIGICLLLLLAAHIVHSI